MCQIYEALVSNYRSIDLVDKKDIICDIKDRKQKNKDADWFNIFV